MHLLCLHGRGTSAAIFESQTSSFRSKLPSTFTFDFIDGPISADAAPGVSMFYPGPYYSFFNTPADLPAAHTWLLAHDLTKYDGVMCFSQGCSLVSSLLLYHPDKQPFKVAIFICGGVPLRVLEELKVPIDQLEYERDAKARKGLLEAATAVERGIARVKTPVPDATTLDEEWESGVDVDAWVREGGRRITVPTVHVYGARDPIRRNGVMLSRMCDGGDGVGRKRVFDHGGGHMIPRSKEASEGIAGLVEWAAQMAGAQGRREEMLVEASA